MATITNDSVQVRLSSLSQLDRRTVASREATALRDAVVSDIGGDPSAVQGVLAEQYACLSALGADYAKRYLTGELPKEEISTWLATVNVIGRVADRLGLQRVPRPVEDLRAFLTGAPETTPQRPQARQSAIGEPSTEPSEPEANGC